MYFFHLGCTKKKKKLEVKPTSEISNFQIFNKIFEPWLGHGDKVGNVRFARRRRAPVDFESSFGQHFFDVLFANHFLQIARDETKLVLRRQVAHFFRHSKPCPLLVSLSTRHLLGIQRLFLSESGFTENMIR